MRKNTGIFFRAAFLTFIMLSFFIMTAAGICKAYEGIRLTAYGEYVKAVSVDDGNIKILDFIINTENP